jgi:hypothetical protein
MKRERFGAKIALATVLALVAALWCLTAAQAQTAGGNLVGKVQDKSGKPLPGATITANQKDTGLTRSTVAESDGTFRLASLPAGTYAVVAELNGFATVTVQNVRLNVAVDRELTVDMSATTVTESITVVDEAPLVQTAPAIGAVVSETQLENLPLNGRQFANLAILAPGTNLSYNSDPTKPTQLTVALNGGIGRNVNYLVDGGDNMDDTIGGALQNFNLESVQEFNIQTQQYKAEYGRSTGGVLTVVTKSGTNNLSGSGWGFFRKKKSLTPLPQQMACQRPASSPTIASSTAFPWAAPSSRTKSTSSPPMRRPTRRRSTSSTPAACSRSSTARPSRRRSRTI